MVEVKEAINKEIGMTNATKKLAKKNNMKEMANRFRAVRRLACYSQEEIGKIIGVSYQQVQKYESAIDRIPAVSLYMVAKALDVSVKEFFPESTINPSNDVINNEVWAVARKLMAIKNPVIRKKVSSMISSLEGM